MLRHRQDRDRAGPVPGPPLRRLVPAHHLGHAGARVPVRHRGNRPKSPGSGLIPVTLGEVRRLLAHLITTTPSRTAAWAWSRWRRHHQYCARTSHYQRRQAIYHEVLLYIKRQPPTPAAANASNRIALTCPPSSDISALTCLDDLYRPSCHSFTPRWSPTIGHELLAVVVIGHISGTSRRDLPRSDENRRDLSR